MAQTSLSRHFPPCFSRGSVEAVECFLGACPRLAKACVPVELLGCLDGGLMDARTFGFSALGARNGEQVSVAKLGNTTDATHGRMLPLQTLCFASAQPNVHTVTLARALLKRHPEAPDHPLPRGLRYTARGAGHASYVCSVATALRCRLSFAEESGCVPEELIQLRDVFFAVQMCQQNHQRSLGGCASGAGVDAGTGIGSSTWPQVRGGECATGSSPSMKGSAEQAQRAAPAGGSPLTELPRRSPRSMQQPCSQEALVVLAPIAGRSAASAGVPMGSVARRGRRARCAMSPTCGGGPVSARRGRIVALPPLRTSQEGVRASSGSPRRCVPGTTLPAILSQ